MRITSISERWSFWFKVDKIITSGNHPFNHLVNKPIWPKSAWILWGFSLACASSGIAVKVYLYHFNFDIDNTAQYIYVHTQFWLADNCETNWTVSQCINHVGCRETNWTVPHFTGTNMHQMNWNMTKHLFSCLVLDMEFCSLSNQYVSLSLRPLETCWFSREQTPMSNTSLENKCIMATKLFFLIYLSN